MRLALALVVALSGCREMLCAARGGTVLYDQDWAADCTLLEHTIGRCPRVEVFACAEVISRWPGYVIIDSWTDSLR